ncbi:alpha/beta-hydrolase [Schizopora paradoxa]|uniref:Alpha/beta-hydrolase n=1 Tax=Schizopora paradoxa TaxID=27342 RepID=A0A0H2S1P5_9AGAM|nr:alpha/beta-hydrolase [Schizopora paradoxa]
MTTAKTSTTTLHLGGIPLTIYGLQELPKTPIAVEILFFLHGRMSERKSIDMFVRDVLPKLKRPTVIVTLDHRNHGERLVDLKANRGWNDSGVPKDTLENEDHAIDMPALYSGTAMDVSLLVTYLPLKLWPNSEHHVARFGCAGISLGGHSTWLVGAKDPRVSILVPIIGSPNPGQLLRHRAANTVPKPNLTEEVANAIEGVTDYDTSVWKNKHILALCGAIDPVVPPKESQTETYVERLKNAGIDVELIVEEGVGHTVSEKMLKELVLWLNSSRFD